MMASEIRDMHGSFLLLTYVCMYVCMLGSPFTWIDSAERKKAVHAAIMHSWNGYKHHAWGHDELKPLAKTGEKVSQPKPAPYLLCI